MRKEDLNRSSIEDSIIIHKHMSIKYVSEARQELHGFHFLDFLLSKDISEKFSASGSHFGQLVERVEYPLALSPLCGLNISDEGLKIPPYDSWESIQSKFK